MAKGLNNLQIKIINLSGYEIWPKTLYLCCVESLS